MRRSLAVGLLAAILLAILASACTSNSQSISKTPAGGLQVFLEDASGNPVVGAKVVSNYQPDGQLKVTGLTDGSGVVTFRSIQLGKYEFYISGAGLPQGTFTVTVEGPNEKMTITVTREPGTTTTSTY
jgi:hypothetical protein